MPFRTRDFALFLLTVAFLIAGISTTVSQDLNKNNSATVISFTSTTDEIKNYEAVLPSTGEDKRPSRLATLKTKVADFLDGEAGELIAIAEVDDKDSVEDSNEDVQTVKNSVSLCTNYSPNSASWSHNNLKFEIVEGARIVYRETPAIMPDLATPVREVLLQLPLRTTPLSYKTCLSSDVVGIALDGSLIRNDEYSIYKIFGAETLIGYALDGFPIYGLKENLSTDNCGGDISSGEYKYYISKEREGVLGCFSGIPTNF